jgi:molybdopterin synthase catalytic subunit
VNEFPEVAVRHEDFDTAEEQRRLLGAGGSVGAIATFVGVVRDANELGSLEAMELEHYPGMTERSIQDIVDEAKRRWALAAVRVIHRVGRLSPGEQIVYVGVAGAHRGEAFDACEFIMDYLKTRAPFWKKELADSGSHWVQARDSDDDAAARWDARTVDDANHPNRG